LRVGEKKIARGHARKGRDKGEQKGGARQPATKFLRPEGNGQRVKAEKKSWPETIHALRQRRKKEKVRETEKSSGKVAREASKTSREKHRKKKKGQKTTSRQGLGDIGNTQATLNGNPRNWRRCWFPNFKPLN